MPVTFAVMKEYASRALGGAATETAGPTQARIANAAGRHLYSMYSWRFRIRPPALLAFTANQPYVDLPADLARVTQYRLNGLTQDFSFTSMGHLARLRDRSITPVGFHWWGAITQPLGASTLEPMPAPRIELYPIPTSTSATPDLQIWYLAKWLDLDDDAQYAQIPWYVESLLIEIVQQYAKGWILDESPYAFEGMDELQKSPSFKDAKREDRYQPDLGVVMGGAVESSMAGSIGYLPYGDVTIS